MKKSEIAAHREANSPPKRRRDPKGRRRRLQVRTSRKKSFIRLIFRQMGFSTLTKTDFAALHCFSKSKSICADASAESRAIHAIWTPQNGGKRGGCVLSRAKLLILFRTDAIFQKKTFNTIEKQRTSAQNKWTFFRTPPVFRPNHAPFWEKPIFGGLLSSSLAFPRAQTGPNGHAPTHIAHSASLHFLPSPFTFTHNTLIIKRNKGEDKHRFNTSPVKAMQALPSPLTLSAPKFYAHEVKR